MKYFFLFFSVLGIIFFATPGLVHSKGTVVGEGAYPCQRYASRPLDKKNVYIVWAQGYITAYNSLSGKTPNVVGSHDYNWVRLWLDDYCQKNPEKFFNDAVVALTEELTSPGK